MKSGGNHYILFVILSVLIFAPEDWKVIAGPRDNGVWMKEEKDNLSSEKLRKLTMDVY